MTQALLCAGAALAVGGVVLLAAGRWLPARWSGWAALGVAAAALALFLVFHGGPVQVSLFCWLPADGPAVALTYRFDALAVALILLSGVAALLLLLWMGLAVSAEEGPHAPWVLVLLALFWYLLGSADLLLAYAHWEVLLLATYGLLVFRRTALPTPGIAEWFLGTQHMAGYPFLFALLLCGAPLGTWEYARWGVGAVTGAALLLLLLTAWVRTAQVPFQAWALAAAGCPGPASTLLLGGWGLLAGPYLWLRFLSRLDGTMPQEVALVAGSVSLVVSAALALRQESGRQVQAGDTIARLGLVWIALGLGGTWGVAAGWFLLFDLLLSKVLLHAALSGHGPERPFRQALYILGMWGGLGLPPSLGFVGRWLLALGLFQTGRGYYLPVLLLALPLTMWYAWRGWNLVPRSGDDGGTLERVARRSLAGLLALAPLAGLGAPWLWSALLEPATRAVLGTVAGDIVPALEALLAWLLPAVLLLLLLGAGGIVWSGALRQRKVGPALAAGLTAGPLQEPLPVLPDETAWLVWLGQLAPLYRFLGRLGGAVVLAARNAVSFLERHTTYFLLVVLSLAAAILIVLTR